MAAPHKTQIITSADQVPEGYVPISEFKGTTPALWRTVHKALSDAHATGLIRAVKLVRCLGDCKTGRVFVHGDDARAFLQGRYGRPCEAEQPATPHVEAAAVPRVDELREAIVRLTEAVHDLTAVVRLRAEREFDSAYGESSNGMA